MGSRQRVSVACQSCRKRRIRCDGVKPQCSRCAAKHEECFYQYSEEKRKPPSKRYIQSLLSRIENLENQVAQLEEQNDGAAGPAVPQDNKFTDQQQDYRQTNGPKATPDSVDELVDLCGGLSLGEGQELRFFGSCSNLAMITEQIDERCHEHLLRFSADRSQRPGIVDVEVDQPTQEALLDVFWKWQNPWQYLVHKDAWCRSYEAQDGEYSTPVLLYSMLAVAARYCDRPDAISGVHDPRTAGMAFAAQAKQLIFEEIEAPRVPTVIAAALISVAELAVDLEPAGWTYIGIALRMAYSLGLHVNPNQWVESGHFTAENAEIRSIAWWGCYMIERLYCIALGRPSVCNERDISTPLPTALPEVEFQSSTLHPDQNGSAMSYSVTNFRHTCEMLKLTAAPLDEIYSQDPESKPADKLDTSLKACVALSAFYDRIPSVMRLDKPVVAHIYYFHIHYHSINILFHRPFICTKASGELAENQTHLVECTKSAEALTSILKWIEKHHSLRSATISIIHPALLAGILHLFNMTLPDPAVKAKAKKDFLTTIHCLQHMSIAWTWALRAIRLLRLVAKRWLPEEFSDLMNETEPVVSEGNISTTIHGIPNNDSWERFLQDSDGEDIFQTGLSLFDLDSWSSL